MEGSYSPIYKTITDEHPSKRPNKFFYQHNCEMTRFKGIDDIISFTSFPRQSILCILIEILLIEMLR